MKRLLKIEMERAFHSSLFVLAVLIGMGIFAVHIYQIVLPDAVFIRNIDWNDEVFLKVYSGMQLPNLYTDYMEIFGGSFSILYHFILPVLTGLPYAYTLFTDAKYHYMDQLILRGGQKEYYRAKLFVQFLIGGCVAVLPMILSFAVTAVLLPATRPELISPTCIIYGASVLGELFYRHPLVYVIILWVIDFAGFGIISCLSYVFCELMENRFMVALVPFVLYFCQYVVCSAFGITSVREGLRIAALRQDKVHEVVPYVIGMLVLVCVSHCMKIRKRDLL